MNFEQDSSTNVFLQPNEEGPDIVIETDTHISPPVPQKSIAYHQLSQLVQSLYQHSPIHPFFKPGRSELEQAADQSFLASILPLTEILFYPSNEYGFIKVGDDIFSVKNPSWVAGDEDYFANDFMVHLSLSSDHTHLSPISSPSNDRWISFGRNTQDATPQNPTSKGTPDSTDTHVQTLFSPHNELPLSVLSTPVSSRKTPKSTAVASPKPRPVKKVLKKGQSKTRQLTDHLLEATLPLPPSPRNVSARTPTCPFCSQTDLPSPVFLFTSVDKKRQAELEKIIEKLGGTVRDRKSRGHNPRQTDPDRPIPVPFDMVGHLALQPTHSAEETATVSLVPRNGLCPLCLRPLPSSSHTPIALDNQSQQTFDQLLDVPTIPMSDLPFVCTHLIIGKPLRTVKMVFALAFGCWIVPEDYVVASERAGYWLDEREFEIGSDVWDRMKGDAVDEAAGAALTPKREALRENLYYQDIPSEVMDELGMERLWLGAMKRQREKKWEYPLLPPSPPHTFVPHIAPPAHRLKPLCPVRPVQRRGQLFGMRFVLHESACVGSCAYLQGIIQIAGGCVECVHCVLDEVEQMRQKGDSPPDTLIVLVDRMWWLSKYGSEDSDESDTLRSPTTPLQTPSAILTRKQHQQISSYRRSQPATPLSPSASPSHHGEVTADSPGASLAPFSSSFFLSPITSQKKDAQHLPRQPLTSLTKPPTPPPHSSMIRTESFLPFTQTQEPLAPTHTHCSYTANDDEVTELIHSNVLCLNHEFLLDSFAWIHPIDAKLYLIPQI